MQYEIIEYELWTIATDCPNYYNNSTQVVYFQNFRMIVNATVRTIQGLLVTAIPSIMLVVATGMLIYQLKRIKKVTVLRSSHGNNSHEKSTKLVITVTISFIISTVPTGVWYLIEYKAFNYGTIV